MPETLMISILTSKIPAKSAMTGIQASLSLQRDENELRIMIPQSALGNIPFFIDLVNVTWLAKSGLLIFTEGENHRLVLEGSTSLRVQKGVNVLQILLHSDTPQDQ